jgi:uncharacterized protein (DUF4415 family)
MKTKLSPLQVRELAKLAALPDDQIDTIDIPEIPEASWQHARRAEFFRPVKQPVTIRLDADVIDWFKTKAPEGGYQTEINRVLRGHMVDVETAGSKKAT